MNEHYDHFAGWLGGTIATFFCGISVSAAEIGLKLFTASIALLVGGTTAWYNYEKVQEIKRNKNQKK